MALRIKEILESGGYVLGGFISAASPTVAEAAVTGGLDFVILDTEHGEENFETVINQARAVKCAGGDAIVRVHGWNDHMISRYLDNGLDGVQVPQTDNPELVAAAVRATRYPPLGERGLSGGRGARWGTVKNYPQWANDNTLTVIMCESREAVKNIEETLKIPSIDVIFIGIGDLSLSYGVVGGPRTPEFNEAIEHVLKSCKAVGKPCGIPSSGGEDSYMRLEQGFRYVTVLNDMGLLRSRTTEITSGLRAKYPNLEK